MLAVLSDPVRIMICKQRALLLYFSTLVLGFSSAAFAQGTLPKDLLAPCQEKAEKFQLLETETQSSPDFPRECKAAIENARTRCKDEPKNEGLPDVGGGGANNAANLNLQAAEIARDKFDGHKKGCEKATQPVARACGEAIRQINRQRNDSKDEAERARLLRVGELVRNARRLAAEAMDKAIRCSDGYVKIYDEAVARSRAIANETSSDSSQILSGNTSDAGVTKAGKTLVKDSAKEALKAFSREAAKLVPGGAAGVEIADGNPAGAAKEIAKEFIPLKTAGKIAEKAASITIAPTPTSRCADRLTPVQAYQNGCSQFIPQTATAAIEILSQD